MTDSVEDENSDVSNNKDQMESKDESDDEDKADVKKAVSMKAGMNGSHPVTFTGLRCDTESCKTWQIDFCVDVL